MRAICSSGLSPSRRCIISGERAKGESNGGNGIDPALPSDTDPAPWLPPPPLPPVAEKVFSLPPPNSPAKAARKLPTAALSPDIRVVCRCCTCPKWRSSFEKLKARSTFEPENIKPLFEDRTPLPSADTLSPFSFSGSSRCHARFNRSPQFVPVTDNWAGSCLESHHRFRTGFGRARVAAPAGRPPCPEPDAARSVRSARGIPSHCGA